MSFPRYPEYKDSGVEWLGEVPAHWALRPLLAIASESSEPNVGMKESNLLSLSYGRIIAKDINSNDGLLPDSFETYQIVRKDDLVLRLTDLQNDQRSLRSAIAGETGIITSAYLAIRPVDAVARFLHYLMRTYDLTKVFYSMGGGLRQSIKFADLKRLPVLLPSRAEQLRITAFLDHETAKIDALIAEQEKLIELLKEKRQAVISHAVTKGLDPNVPMKDSGVEWLGDVPEHWLVSRIGRFATIENGTTPSRGNEGYWTDGTIPWIGSGEVNQLRVTEPQELITEEALNACSLRLLPVGTVVVGMIGQGKTRGLSAILDIQATINQNMAAVCPGEQLRSMFALYLFQAAYEWLREAGRGGNQAALNCEIIGEFMIAIPPTHEQERISVFLDDEVARLDVLRAIAEHAIDLLRERRSALISAAVIGSIDVRHSVVEKRIGSPLPCVY